jgi:hypothetical protein
MNYMQYLVATGKFVFVSHRHRRSDYYLADAERQNSRARRARQNGRQLYDFDDHLSVCQYFSDVSARRVFNRADSRNHRHRFSDHRRHQGEQRRIVGLPADN